MKKTLVIFLAVLMVALFPISALAAPADAAETVPVETPGRCAPDPGIDEMQEKFNTLTDGEKAEIYEISDKITELQIELIEKYAELEVISRDEADEMIEMLKSITEQLQSQGKMAAGMMPHLHMVPKDKPGE